MTDTDAVTLQGAMVDARIHHGLLLEDAEPPASLPPSLPGTPRVQVTPRRLNTADRGFLVQLPNGQVVGTAPRLPPPKPSAAEKMAARWDNDRVRAFLVALGNTYGLEENKILTVVPGTDNDDDDDEEGEPVQRIDPNVMQTLLRAVFDFRSAFADRDNYRFGGRDSNDHVLSYIINTSDLLFRDTFLQLASAELRSKEYFQPKFEQYAQNAQLIKHEKLNIFQQMAQHYWDPIQHEFFYLRESAGAGHARFNFLTE